MRARSSVPKHADDGTALMGIQLQDLCTSSARLVPAHIVGHCRVDNIDWLSCLSSNCRQGLLPYGVATRFRCRFDDVAFIVTESSKSSKYWPVLFSSSQRHLDISSWIRGNAPTWKDEHKSWTRISYGLQKQFEKSCTLLDGLESMFTRRSATIPKMTLCLPRLKSTWEYSGMAPVVASEPRRQARYHEYHTFFLIPSYNSPI